LAASAGYLGLDYLRLDDLGIEALVASRPIIVFAPVESKRLLHVGSGFVRFAFDGDAQGTQKMQIVWRKGCCFRLGSGR
jgi:hypothetical protein